MKTGELINRIEKLFYEELDRKTGWGKIEIKTIYSACVNQALREAVDETEVKEQKLREDDDHWRNMTDGPNDHFNR